MTTARSNKMKAGASSPDKFAAAEQAMAAGELTSSAPAPAPRKKPRAAEPVTSVKGKKPAGEGQAVRESLTLLLEESQAIDTLRIKLASMGVIPNRSEVLRAGIQALSVMSESDFEKIMTKVPRLRPGRPT